MELESDFKVRTSEELLAAATGLDIDVATELLADAGGNAWFIAQRVDIGLKYGLEHQQIMRLVAAMALAEKARLSTDERLDMTDGEKVAISFTELCALGHEQLWVVYMDYEGKMIRREMMSSGDMTSTPSVSRLIVRNALMCNAHKIAVVHNHPHASDIQPSFGDIWSAGELKDLLRIFNIEYMDDIIVGGGQYYSFRDNGKLGNQSDGETEYVRIFGERTPRGPAKLPEGMEPLPEEF